jgi:expansin
MSSLLAMSLAGGPVAEVPDNTAYRRGIATHYGPDAPGFACSFVEPTRTGRTTALGPAQFSGADACGMVLKVSGPRGTARVKVTNLCPECPKGHLDLTDEAFRKVGDLPDGRIDIRYKVVTNPKLAGPLTVRVKEGSSRYWLALLVDHHGNPLTSVSVSADGGSWQPLRRTDYNYWLAESGVGPGPFSVRVRDNQGHRVVLRGIDLRPATVQTTSRRMY